MGRYLRMFWYPISAAVELESWPVKKVRLLGEDLALFRCDDGTLGLVADRCPHRGASLSCGMTDGSGIRCAYHGWAFDVTGKCTDTPAEPEASRLRDRIKIAGYPVQEMGGMHWAYLGPLPAPLLPRYEQVVRDDLVRSISVSYVPCNWLQIAENSVDPTASRASSPAVSELGRGHVSANPRSKCESTRRSTSKLFEYGILKKRLWEGDSEDSEEWKTGHPVIFPGTLFVPINEKWVQFQFRVPVDDENTIIYWYDAKEVEPGHSPESRIPMVENPWKTPDGKFMPAHINAQDMMVWITQGPITDHSLENLGEADRGVALYRRTLLEEMDRVERGEDPMGVIRDVAKNTPYVRLPIERHLGYSMAGAAFSATLSFPEREKAGTPS